MVDAKDGIHLQICCIRCHGVGWAWAIRVQSGLAEEGLVGAQNRCAPYTSTTSVLRSRARPYPHPSPYWTHQVVWWIHTVGEQLLLTAFQYDYRTQGSYRLGISNASWKWHA